MSDRFEQASGDLVSIEADIDVVVTHEEDDIIYSLHLAQIKRTSGDLRDGRYKAIILALREHAPITDKEETC